MDIVENARVAAGTEHHDPVVAHEVLVSAFGPAARDERR